MTVFVYAHLYFLILYFHPMSGSPRPGENSEDEDFYIISGGSAGEEDNRSLRQDYEGEIKFKLKISF